MLIEQKKKKMEKAQIIFEQTFFFDLNVKYMQLEFEKMNPHITQLVLWNLQLDKLVNDLGQKRREKNLEFLRVIERIAPFGINH